MSENDLLPMEALNQAAECLKLMAHPVRLKIVELLMQRDSSVQDIAAACQLPHSQTCEHLRLMKGHGFLTSKRKGRLVYYQIASPKLVALIHCIRSTCGAPGEARPQD